MDQAEVVSDLSVLAGTIRGEGMVQCGGCIRLVLAEVGWCDACRARNRVMEARYREGNRPSASSTPVLSVGVVNHTPARRMDLLWNLIADGVQPWHFWTALAAFWLVSWGLLYVVVRAVRLLTEMIGGLWQTHIPMGIVDAVLAVMVAAVGAVYLGCVLHQQPVQRED